jgi:tRNA threonylcarbamoyladenosine biosynthesis protein TsaB
MIKFLAVQHTYQSIEIGLFNDKCLCAKITEDKIHASKNFIPLLNNFLKDHQLKLHDLSFLAANQGPGPFTTLRVVISSVNGLGFAANIPLVGVDGLAAFLDEQSQKNTQTTIVLLNAFAHDVYFGIQQGVSRRTGCANGDALLAEIADIPSSILFVGNAVEMYRGKIEKAFGDRAIIPQPIAEHPTLEQIGINALAQWNNQQSTKQLLPLYLKQYSAVMPY